MQNTQSHCDIKIKINVPRNINIGCHLCYSQCVFLLGSVVDVLQHVSICLCCERLQRMWRQTDGDVFWICYNMLFACVFVFSAVSSLWLRFSCPPAKLKCIFKEHANDFIHINKQMLSVVCWHCACTAGDNQSVYEVNFASYVLWYNNFWFWDQGNIKQATSFQEDFQ